MPSARATAEPGRTDRRGQRARRSRGDHGLRRWRLPGDLHKLWRTRHPKHYHLEYGNTCMGYEIAGGLGIKMAAPDREVYVMVGDGSYLMMNSEIVTSIQEGYKLTIVLLDNDGYKSIGALSRSLGQDGFGTRYVYPKQCTQRRRGGGNVSNPARRSRRQRASLGAHVIECGTYDDFVRAMRQHAPSTTRPLSTSRTTVYTAFRATKVGGMCPSPKQARCTPLTPPARSGKKIARRSVISSSNMVDGTLYASRPRPSPIGTRRKHYGRYQRYSPSHLTSVGIDKYHLSACTKLALAWKLHIR